MVSEKLQLIIDLQNKLFNSKLKQTQDNFNKASNGLMGKASKMRTSHAKAFGAMTDQFPAISRGMDLLSNKYVLMAGLAAGVGLIACLAFGTWFVFAGNYSLAALSFYFIGSYVLQ